MQLRSFERACQSSHGAQKTRFQRRHRASKRRKKNAGGIAFRPVPKSQPHSTRKLRGVRQTDGSGRSKAKLMDRGGKSHPQFTLPTTAAERASHSPMAALSAVRARVVDAPLVRASIGRGFCQYSGRFSEQKKRGAISTSPTLQCRLAGVSPGPKFSNYASPSRLSAARGLQGKEVKLGLGSVLICATECPGPTWRQLSGLQWRYRERSYAPNVLSVRWRVHSEGRRSVSLV